MNAATLLASAEEVVTELPVAPLGYGILTLTALVAMLLVTFAFRSVGHRH